MAKELSGALWVSRFPGSSSTNDLQGTFRASVNNFLRALGNARARVSISATYRPPARAYLMHWSWLIAHEIVQAKNVPAMEGWILSGFTRLSKPRLKRRRLWLRPMV